jgi:hypothetical protein
VSNASRFLHCVPDNSGSEKPARCSGIYQTGNVDQPTS